MPSEHATAPSPTQAQKQPQKQAQKCAQLAIFIGGIRPLPLSGRPTGIYKSPLTAPVLLGTEGFAGDQQADRRVHGGPEKAVHLYPARHYAKLAARFPDAATALVPGSLGENLSTADLDEHDVRIGDIWQLGEALLQVCQARSPCWKIDERFGVDGMAQFIEEKHLTGWYWRVLQSGQVGPSDVLTLHTPALQAPSLHAALVLWQQHRPPLEAFAALAETPGIATRWQEKIRQRLHYLRKLT
ncbi:MOSC domain-containing protein [Azonexus sp.]|uniref:MOSC domain-containing protein n=1 Tax=Azonexus sp. TaxID=1872668 RepID=UPI0039E50D4E